MKYKPYTKSGNGPWTKSTKAVIEAPHTIAALEILQGKMAKGRYKREGLTLIRSDIITRQYKVVMYNPTKD